MNKTYHFVGIKGAGMSALALLLHQMGAKVQGSDSTDYYFTQRGLEQAGIPLLAFDSQNINADLELIVGNAFREDNNVEVAYAIKQGYHFKRYHEFLGELMKQFTAIGVAGAHGKTSTTGLLAHVMTHLTDTSFLIGDGTGRGSASSEYFVFESDEYERHFMPYHPEYSIITNVDFDHPDYFTSIDDVFSAFKDYADQVTKGVFVYGEDAYLKQLNPKSATLFTYGFDASEDYVASQVLRTTSGSKFDATYRGELLGSFSVPTFGKHNILNALAVIAVAHQNGMDMRKVAEHMQSFKGVKRRFSEKMVGETVIIDDFAHHPTEIEATIDAARQKYPNREIVAVFQPHTFTRTIALLDEFARALNQADSVYLAQIYGSARETDNGQVKIEDLKARLTKKGAILTVENVSPLLDHSQAVYVFMGAGNIQQYEYSFENLLSQLTENVQ